ncbi:MULTISPECIES: hypothetical protein [Pseudomonas]|uniref:hypothetical protein n=1 Tax=Pseudomonas TaxID=286 RepID=UPI00128FC8BA|nr:MULTISPECIES: hypothetical protein [Pseudomonas]MCO7506786.1 hypothetical protein [Pseudomonas sp. VE 267-6A]MCO7531470.1 hypothetical protein [Pseudomonas sp. 2]
MFAFPRPLCMLGLALAFTSAHASDPINLYQGTLGERKVEVALQYTSQYEYVQGYLLDTEHHTSQPLEVTPYSKDVPLLINIMDNPRMPAAALRVRPFVFTHDRDFSGEWIDLRTRERVPFSLTRQTRFSDEQRSSWQGALLQQPQNRGKSFYVHASKAEGEYTGKVDRITIIDLASGSTLQVLDNLALAFNGTRTLTFADYNGDGIIDFRASPIGQRATGGANQEPDQFYLYQPTSNTYQRHTELEALGDKGALKFPAPGWVAQRQGSNYDTGTSDWQYYHFVDPKQLVWQRHSVEPF